MPACDIAVASTSMPTAGERPATMSSSNFGGICTTKPKRPASSAASTSRTETIVGVWKNGSSSASFRRADSREPSSSTMATAAFSTSKRAPEATV